MTSRRLEGRIAVITGAASGIGEACARLFASEGAVVIAVDKTKETGEVVARSIRETGGIASFVHADLGRESDCKRVIEDTLAEHGKIDVLLNNAGMFLGKSVPEATSEEFDSVFQVNVKAPFWLCKYVLPHMEAQGKGAICLMASKTGLVAQYDSPLYCASKGAVVLLMKALALDYAKKGIRVNAVCPGIIDTPMLDYAINLAPDPIQERRWNEAAQPIGRLGKPDECAHAALYLCSDEASFITGVAVPVDGGFTAM